MGNHDNTVSRHSHVEFERAYAQFERALKGGQRILGQQTPGAPMTLHVDGPHGFRPLLTSASQPEPQSEAAAE